MQLLCSCGFYGYDAAGRPNSVVSPAGTFGYTYKAVSYSGQNHAGGLVQTLDQPGAYQVDGMFDALGRRLTTVLKNGAATVNSHTYTYNAGHQRTKQTLTDASYVDYAYDHLGQLDTALTKTSGGSPVSGQQFDYGYDAGWNLTTRATGSGTTTCGVNDRNQVTGGAGVSYGHDAHGNRITESLGSGSLSYTYDAEQQLVGVATDTYYTPESGRWKVAFTYDGRGRVRVRQDYYWSGGNWYLNTDRRYVYDGMLVVQERTSSQVPLVSYTRGVDLSGSLAGAGGIGGLLARSTHATTSPYAVNSSAYYHADGNGNVTYLLTAGQTLGASYKYDPYGRNLSSSGSLSAANTYQFSSKPLTSAGYYYGYRFYDPNTQRWLNRDPIQEDGGYNLYRIASQPSPSKSSQVAVCHGKIIWMANRLRL